MNTFTLSDIRKLNPCYDPALYLPEDWTGTAVDILRVETCPAKDRLWVVLHDGWIDERTLCLFAVWCIRRALAMIADPDPRSLAACDVAERYANSEATIDELLAAADAAADAALATHAALAADATDATAHAAAEVKKLLEMLEADGMRLFPWSLVAGFCAAVLAYMLTMDTGWAGVYALGAFTAAAYLAHRRRESGVI